MARCIVKVMKNGLDEYGIWYGVDTDKATKLMTKRFFKSPGAANRYARKLAESRMKNLGYELVEAKA